MLVGISGGIGSGKSVVSNILRAMGYAVYDCDREAKRLMEEQLEIHRKLCEHIHPEAVVEGKINRELISNIVFCDKSALLKLNSIVHAAVFEDIERWRKSYAAGQLLFVESAILHSSGLYRLVDDEWRVEAPLNVRIERVKKRSGLSGSEIRARIKSQEQEESHRGAHIIDNSPESALLPRIHKLLLLTNGVTNL